MKDSQTRIFSPQAHLARCTAVDSNDPRCVEDPIGNYRGSQTFAFYDALPEKSTVDPKRRNNIKDVLESPRDGHYDGYTWLHYAIDECDPLLAYEAIRFGALPEQRTTVTPGLNAIQLVMKRIYLLHYCLEMGERISPRARNHPKFSADMLRSLQDSQLQTKHRFGRLCCIATMLVKQHANLNEAVHCRRPEPSSQSCIEDLMTPLSVSILVGDWDLVALFLQYGAEIGNPLVTSLLEQRGEQQRFDDLVLNYKGLGRPPRQCPCFSGKDLKDCHSSSLPYPKSYRCPCGSKKSNERCCAQRNTRWVETWNEEQQWIQPSRTREIYLPR